jgi:hypothetical protein
MNPNLIAYAYTAGKLTSIKDTQAPGGHVRVNLKLGARYYNPTTGRFTQPDPSGKEANTYNYTACNPVNSTDPSGLDALGCVGAVAGFGSAAIAFTLSAISFFSTPADGPVGPAAGWGFLSVGLGAFSAGVAGYESCRS